MSTRGATQPGEREPADRGGLAGVPSLTPLEARRALEAPGSDFVLLDVREPEELALARIEGALAIPMGEIPSRLAAIPRDRRIGVLCHHGVRSWQVAALLQAHGWPRVANVAGGIERWSLEADPRVPRYERPG